MKQEKKRQQHSYRYLIDEHGDWFCEGIPVEDRDVLRVLSRSIHQTGQGSYVIRCEGEEHGVQVMDAPLFVHCIHVALDSAEQLLHVQIELTDGRRETLAAETLETVNKNSLYCLATPRRLKAKFGKTAYYELTRHLQVTDDEETFYLIIQGKRFDIAEKVETSPV